MNQDCNTGIKQNGKLCPCRLGLGHLGQHEYKEPTKEQTDGDISNEGALIGFVICTAIIILFYVTVIERWFANDYWNPLGWGMVILTFFGSIAWLVFTYSLIQNFYWSRKPNEIWIKNKNASEYAKIYGEDWMKLEKEK